MAGGVEHGARKITIVTPMRQTLALLADWDRQRDVLKKEDALYSMMQAGFLGEAHKPERPAFVPSERRSFSINDYFVDPHSKENVQMLRVGVGVLINLTSVYLGATPEDISLHADALAVLDSLGLTPRVVNSPIIPFGHAASGEQSEVGYFADMKEVGKAINIELNRGIEDVCVAIERLPEYSPIRGMYDKMTNLLNTMQTRFGMPYDTRYTRSSSLVANFLNTGVSTAEDAYNLTLRTAYRHAGGNIAEAEQFFAESTIPSQLSQLFIESFYPSRTKLTGGGEVILPEFIELNPSGKLAIASRPWQEILEEQKNTLQQMGRYRTGCPAFPDTILFVQRDFFAANSRAWRQQAQQAA